MNRYEVYTEPAVSVLIDSSVPKQLYYLGPDKVAAEVTWDYAVHRLKHHKIHADQVVFKCNGQVIGIFDKKKGDIRMQRVGVSA